MEDKQCKSDKVHESWRKNNSKVIKIIGFGGQTMQKCQSTQVLEDKQCRSNEKCKFWRLYVLEDKQCKSDKVHKYWRTSNAKVIKNVGFGGQVMQK